MSKGSKPRPLSIPKETFDSNWEKIFKPKKQPNKKGNRSGN